VDAGERERLETFFREKRETMFRCPIASQLVRLLMTCETIFQTFSEKFIQLRTQSIRMRNARRARRHVLLGVFLQLDEIKIVATVLCCCSFGERSFRANENSETWRHRPSLLRSR